VRLAATSSFQSIPVTSPARGDATACKIHVIYKYIYDIYSSLSFFLNMREREKKKKKKI
jgi:hypothetical protein